MVSFFHGCRYAGVPVLITLCAIVALHFSQQNWQSWQSSIDYAPYWLLTITSLLAIQFNRSRLAYIAGLLLLYYSVVNQQWLTDNTLALYQDVWAVAIGLVIGVLLLTKDRGLLSPHSLLRGAAIIVCFGLAYLWLRGLDDINLFVQQKLGITLDPMVQIYAPIGLVALIVIARTVWQANLVNSAISITFGLWLMHTLQPQLLPLSVLLCVVAVAYLLAILIDSYFLAYRDELTGLPSRRALYNLVLSLGRTYSVAMVDIDHFKKFNDTYGHDVGDQVLKLVAAKLAKVTGNGKVFRYGGEEFTIVFPRKNTDETLDHLQGVREAIEQYQIVLRDEKRKQQTKQTRGKANSKNQQTVSVTVSIGVAEHLKGQTFDQCMKVADEALYRAKKKGRNQVCQ
ncbi:GGDEF domain-containing protein [Shewanella waksmanii]|uniref:GGDEF domain-containing protein n=1 Tax=Shewanella waksmanii TaxID=213783 RepID=UPI00048AB79E|nr:GGDEF domain-containing protein [Shewanella waksmanii]